MNTKDEVAELKEQLRQSRQEIEDLKEKSGSLTKAIWDILNYASVYIVILDRDMNVRLLNWSLATDLGFESEKDVIGKCWMDFIPVDNRELVRKVHHYLSTNERADKYREITNNIETLKKSIISVKWFNIPVNSGFNLTFSVGIKIDEETNSIIAEDSIRSYYRDIIQKDRTMIQSLRDVVVKDFGHNVNVQECLTKLDEE